MIKEWIVKMTACFVMIGLMAAGSAQCREVIIESLGTSQPVTIDGLDEEWEPGTLRAFESNNIQLGFQNDRENLYILFIFTNPQIMSSVKETGLSVYFSTEGKKKKDNGFLFKTYALSSQDLIRLLEKKGESLSEEKRREIMSRPQYFHYNVQLIQKKKIMDLPEDEGTEEARPLFRNAGKGPFHIYEFQIPLSRIGQQNATSRAPDRILKIGFKWGGLTDEQRQTMMTKQVDMTIDSDTRNNDSFENRLSTYGFTDGQKERSFWVDIKLAPVPEGQ